MLLAKGRLIKGKSVERKLRTRLCRDLIEDICREVKNGNFPGTVGRAYGIPASTFSTWMKRGRYDQDQGNETVFAELHQRVEQARAEGEVALTRLGLQLVKAGKSTWMGAYRHLESYNRDNWLKTKEIKINATHTMKDSIDVPPDPPQSHAEWFQRRAERSNQVEELGAVETEYEICAETN